MKMITSTKVLALAASMLVAGTGAIDAKPKKPGGGSVSGDLVISKVFYNNMMNDEEKAFIMANYIELYNNSGDTLDITGIYLGVADNTSSTSSMFPYAWTAANMKESHKDKIALKQVFRISADNTCLLAPGKSIVICNAAENHTLVAQKAPDLTQADFEVKSEHTAYKDHHNANVPALELVYTNSASNTFLQFMSPGPYGLVLLAADSKVETFEEDFYRDQADGVKFMIVPAYKTIDAVDFVEHSAKTEPDASQKRMPDSYDAGWIATTLPGGNHGEALMRKTAFITPGGRTVLYDTNNSSVDFEVTTDLSIRTYGTALAGLSETSITIPESGYLAVKMEKPFFGGNGVVFAYVNASGNSSDFAYNEFAGDSLLLMSADWIAIAKPGTYKVFYSEAQPMLRTRSTSQEWSDENHLELTGGKKNRTIYKFSNAVGSVGFQRVPATGGNYNVADFADGDRLFVSLTPTIVDNFKATLSVSDLDFIPWHGTTPDQIVNGISTMNLKPASSAIFDLQGRRVNGKPTHGIYIVNGKKVAF